MTKARDVTSTSGFLLSNHSTNILKGNREDRPYVQFLHEKKDGKGYTVLLELEDKKDAFEIVNFYKIREDTVRGLKKREKIK